ncbi:MAG: PKD domain-containing protein, partial [Candidatus Thermoplasmatota archaeon]
TGSCYVFIHTGEGWVEETKILASDGQINDFFGRSVSLDDEYAIVGAWGDNGSSGSAYVFKQTNTSWTEEGKLTATDGASDDRFGYQVALEGRNAIIGAYLDDNSNGIDAGSAYVFTREDANQPPSTPSITGPSEGKIKVPINYTFLTIDPDGDEVHYRIDWGDGTTSGWVGPYSSGEEITRAHTWSKKGDYTIKTKAKDNNGAESEWGELPVTMPSTYHLSFLQCYATLFERFPYASLILRYLLRR